MNKQQYKKVTFDFPAEEYEEDELDVMALKKAREENEKPIPWEKAKKQLGRNNP